MKHLGIYILIALLGISCGEKKESNENLQEGSISLFFSQDYEVIDKALDPTLLGLWHSENFRINDVTYEILWEVTEEHTTLALKCQLFNQPPKYVQVSAEYADDLVRAFDNFSLTDFLLPEELIVTDRKNLFPDRALGANQFPREQGPKENDPSIEHQNSLSDIQSLEADSSFSQIIPVEDNPNEGLNRDAFYDEPLCFIAIDSSHIEDKGLLASGMEPWSTSENEDHTDGRIELQIEHLGASVTLRKIQNR